MVLESIESTERVTPASPEKEYISGGPRVPLIGGYGTVASRIHEITESAGPWLADWMATDEKISGSIRTIKHGVQAQGMQITATVSIDPEETPDDLTQDDIDTAFRIEDHCERCRRNMQGSWYELLNRLMDAMLYRTMLAEVVKTVADSGVDEGLYVLDRIPVKDPGTWRFVRDAYGNVRGIECDTPTGRKIIERDHFLILPWLPRSSRPWGQGLLAEAYNPWNFKVQLYPRLWDYVDQFAAPIVHVSPPEQTPGKLRQVIGEDGKPTGDEVSHTYAMAQEVIQALQRKARVIGTPFGSTLDLKVPSGNGAVFQLVFDMLDRAIVYAMHNTTRASMESTRSSRSDAETGQDLLALVVSYGKWALKEALVRDLWYTHVLQNWGQEIADRFTPDVSFGMTNPEDFSRNSNAVYRLYSVGAITPEERPDALRFLGLQFSRRRRKSQPAADLQTQPQPNGRPVQVLRKGAA
jgi:hypothetical protein